MPHMKQTSTVLSSNNLSTYCNHRSIMNTPVTPQHDALFHHITADNATTTTATLATATVTTATTLVHEH
eukprot:9762-Heterococcus_DN1.PRE.2